MQQRVSIITLAVKDLAALLSFLALPEDVEISTELIPEERPRDLELEQASRNEERRTSNSGFHEKSEKNSKTNQGGSYRREIAKKYKKPKTRGDKNYNNRNKKK